MSRPGRFGSNGRFKQSGMAKPRGTARRLGDVLLAIVILGLLVLLAARLDFSPSASLAGLPTVADGDSLTIAGQRIRLVGIDAPELGQTCGGKAGDYACGTMARQALIDIIGGATVTCSGSRRDRYDRLLASCSAGRLELNREMVRIGWAVAYGDFDAEESHARERGAGLWRGSFQQPRDWREAHEGAGEREQDFLATLLGWLRGFFSGE